jgi:hypothetical protein
MSNHTMNRRKFVRGAAAVSAAGATSALFGGTIARAAVGASQGGMISGMAPGGPVDLAKYHCSLVHKAMSDKLTRIVADPNVSSRDTAHALKTTFCPCCKTQINASFPVVPWSELGKAYG